MAGGLFHYKKFSRLRVNYYLYSFFMVSFADRCIAMPTHMHCCIRPMLNLFLRRRRTMIVTISILSGTCHKYEVQSYHFLVRPLSAIQLFCHPSTSTCPGNWTTLGNQGSGIPGETISLLVLCSANIWWPGILNLQRLCLLGVPIHTSVEWSLIDSFLVPKRTSHQASVGIKQGTPLSVVEQATSGPTRPVMYAY